MHNWTFYAVVHDSTEIKVYANGELISAESKNAKTWDEDADEIDKEILNSLKGPK